MRIAARLSLSSSSAPSLRLAASMNASPPDTRAFGSEQILRQREPAVGPRDQQARFGADQLAHAADQRFDQRVRFERGEDAARDRRQRGQAFVLHREFGAAQHGLGDVAQHHARSGCGRRVLSRAAAPTRWRRSANRRAGRSRTPRAPVRRAAASRACSGRTRHVGLRAGELARGRADDVLALRAALSAETQGSRR